MPILNVNDGDYVKYTTGVATFTEMILSVWINVSSLDDFGAAGAAGVIAQKDPGTTGFYFLIANDILGDQSHDNCIAFARGWDGGAIGYWYSNENIITTGSWINIGVWYDGSNVANDPRFYVDGTGSADHTEFSTPIAPLRDISSFPLYLGTTDNAGDFASIQGSWSDARIYDITGLGWVQANVDNFMADIYNSKSMRLAAPYPVFRAKGNGASGLQAYDGVSLATSNKIIDDISGLSGDPTGSPTGRDETVLACGH